MNHESLTDLSSHRSSRNDERAALENQNNHQDDLSLIDFETFATAAFAEAVVSFLRCPPSPAWSTYKEVDEQYVGNCAWKDTARRAENQPYEGRTLHEPSEDWTLNPACSDLSQPPITLDGHARPQHSVHGGCSNMGDETRRGSAGSRHSLQTTTSRGYLRDAYTRTQPSAMPGLPLAHASSRKRKRCGHEDQTPNSQTQAKQGAPSRTLNSTQQSLKALAPRPGTEASNLVRRQIAPPRTRTPRSNPLFGSSKRSELGPFNDRIPVCIDPFCHCDPALRDSRARYQHVIFLLAFATQCFEVKVPVEHSRTGPVDALAGPLVPGEGQNTVDMIDTVAEVEVLCWDRDGHQLYICGHPKCAEAENGNLLVFREKHVKERHDHTVHAVEKYSHVRDAVLHCLAAPKCAQNYPYCRWHDMGRHMESHLTLSADAIKNYCDAARHRQKSVRQQLRDSSVIDDSRHWSSSYQELARQAPTLVRSYLNLMLRRIEGVTLELVQDIPLVSARTDRVIPAGPQAWRYLTRYRSIRPADREVPQGRRETIVPGLIGDILQHYG